VKASLPIAGRVSRITRVHNRCVRLVEPAPRQYDPRGVALLAGPWRVELVGTTGELLEVAELDTWTRARAVFNAFAERAAPL
jgi:hypothetical protein